MDSPTSEASFDFVDTLGAERGGGGGTFEVEENGGDELGAADQQDQIKFGQLLEHQTLLKMEEYQKEQRHNLKEIFVQIGELKKLVGPVAASALAERRADIDQALRANVAATEKGHRKLLMDHEALRAEVAEMKRLQKMQEQRQAQMLLRLDELCKAFTGGSVLLERVNSFVDLAADLKELKQFIMKTVKEGTEDGTEAVKEESDGTEAVKEESDGTEAVKEESDGTEAVKEKSDGTEAVKEESDGTEAVKEESDGTEAVKEGTEDRVLLSQQKVQMLERAFTEMKFPSVSDCKNLAQSFRLTPLLVKFWFQTRRAKHFREQEMMRGRRMDGEVAGEGVRSGRSMGPEGIGSAESEGPSPLPIAGMRTVKEGTDGTEAVKERSEGGTEAAKEGTWTEAFKEGSEGGTEAVKERSEGGTEAVKERSEGGTEAAKKGSEGGTEVIKEGSEGVTKAALNRLNALGASPMDMKLKHNPFGTLDSTLFNSGHFITSCNGYHPMPFFNQAYSTVPYGQMHASAAPYGQMHASAAPYGQMHASAAPYGQMHASAAPYGQMHASAAPYGQMHASAAPYGQMHASAAPYPQMPSPFHAAGMNGAATAFEKKSTF